jgi:hypothetical protein
MTSDNYNNIVLMDDDQQFSYHQPYRHYNQQQQQFDSNLPCTSYQTLQPQPTTLSTTTTTTTDLTQMNRLIIFEQEDTASFYNNTLIPVIYNTNSYENSENNSKTIDKPNETIVQLNDQHIDELENDNNNNTNQSNYQSDYHTMTSNQLDNIRTTNTVPTINNVNQIFQLISLKIAKYCQALTDLTNCEVFYKAELPLETTKSTETSNCFNILLLLTLPASFS